MKKSTLLLKLRDWRRRFFYTPNEVEVIAKAAHAEGSAAEAAQLQETFNDMCNKAQRFSVALQELRMIKMETRKPFYEVRVSIAIQALQTAVGDAAAVAIIAQEVGEKVLARHRKQAAQ